MKKQNQRDVTSEIQLWKTVTFIVFCTPFLQLDFMYSRWWNQVPCCELFHEKFHVKGTEDILCSVASEELRSLFQRALRTWILPTTWSKLDNASYPISVEPRVAMVLPIILCADLFQLLIKRLIARKWSYAISSSLMHESRMVNVCHKQLTLGITFNAWITIVKIG